MDFTNVRPEISLTKTAYPASVPETGGEVTYTFVVTNNGAEAVDFDGLTDDLFGDISGDLSEDEAGTIPVTLPVSIAAGGSFTCDYTGDHRRRGGDQPRQHGHRHRQRRRGRHRQRFR